MLKFKTYLNYKSFYSTKTSCNLIEVENIIDILRSGTLIKDDKSTRITYVHKPSFNQPVIVKQFKFKGWFHCVLRSISISRAMNYSKSSKLISKLGIITPKVIAAKEKKIGMLSTESYVITEFYTGQNAKILIEHPEYFSKKTFEDFTDKVINILATLFKNNITHGDTKVPNFMIKEQDVCIIDLDVVHIHKSSKKLKKYIRKDIERFERDWESHPYKETVLSKTKILRESFLDK